MEKKKIIRQNYTLSSWAWDEDFCASIRDTFNECMLFIQESCIDKVTSLNIIYILKGTKFDILMKSMNY